MLEYLNNPAVIIAIIGAVFIGMKKLADAKGWKVQKGLEVIEAAVLTVYQTYVKEKKAKAKDGKLTSAEAKHARSKALDIAIEIAKTEGVDLAKQYGEKYLPVLIEKAVNAAKR